MRCNRDHVKKFVRALIKLYGIAAISGSAIFVSGETLVFPPYGHSYGIRKATPKHLFMFFGPVTFFSDPQGLATAKMNSRNDPSTEKDDDEVVVYGVNSGRHQLIYNTSMWTLGIYGSKGSGKDQFLDPRGVTTNAEGHVFVADRGNDRIVHLFNPRKDVHWVKAIDGCRGGGHGLKKPEQVALGARGNVYVSDTGNRRLVVFDSSGAIIRTIPPAGTAMFVNGPAALAVADGRQKWSYFNKDRFILCADKQGSRLWKITFGGEVLIKTAMPSNHKAQYAAVDYYHNLWVTDKENHCILKFDHNLELLDIFGSHGKDDNQFVQPRGIAIWKRYGQTFIAEKSGAQYYWIGTELKSAKMMHAQDNIYELFVDCTEYSYLTLFKPANEDTTFLLKKRRILPGGTTVKVTDRKNIVSQGTTLTLRVEATYSCYTYYHWDYPVTVK
ncbi:MAG: hypothetical protein GF350_13935 [Chitinivibrionales bacterium]|nr:hypothetical protein [Chitinivibrionales bacterium]